MSLIRPFRGLRPLSERAGDVIAPPYDVLSTAEARDRARGRRWSFLHISKPEIDLPPQTDPYDSTVYAKGAANLRHMLDAGVLNRDPQPCLYVYRLTMGEHVQTGLVAAASVADYDRNRIRKHEFTRPVKEDDRVQHIDALNAQTGPVLLVHPDAPEVDTTLAEITVQVPPIDVTADDGVRHELWIVDSAPTIESLVAWFDAMEALYIADGHHRSAAASRVAANRRLVHPDPQASWESFLAVIFPRNQMKILDYNRVIADLNGLDRDQFLAALAARCTVEVADAPVKPTRSGEFGLYLPGGWYRLVLRPELIPQDPVGRLDVSLLHDHLVQPILGISDPRTDARIDFVGGIRGLGELERRVDSGEMAVAFALFPTTMDALMAVADAGEVMPPKSTWFEPKLADGLVSQVLD